MNLPQAVVFAALAVLVVELVRGRRKPALVFSAVAFAFVLLDYISLPKGLAQFTNTGLVTVVVLLLLSVVLDKSRLLETMAERLVRGSYRGRPSSTTPRWWLRCWGRCGAAASTARRGCCCRCAMPPRWAAC